MTIPVPLQESLRDSITSGTFIDTKFWVFSKRVGTKTGCVGGPKALFVNERVARRVPRLAALLDGRKPRENLRERFPTDRKSYIRNYDYDDDSDLEDDDGGQLLDDDSADTPQVTTKEPGNDSSELVAVDSSDVKSNESSDIISISDLDSVFSGSSNVKDQEDPIPSAHVGKVVVIEDIAFVTSQALLRYLYTNEIEFALWGSAERREVRAQETVSESYGIPKPSPKSIYRLADKYDIPDLKELALRQIQQDLSKCNIVEEVFSKYTSRYPDLRELELRQLARTLLSSDSGPASELLKKKINSYTNGQLPHAKHVISALYQFMEGNEPVEEKSIPAAVPPRQQVASGDWAGLKKALICSLTSGTFLDTQFYAVESRSSADSSKVQPMYFCSMVGGGLVSKLLASSSKLEPRRGSPRHGDEYDSDIEDEEPDQERSVGGHPSFKYIRENPTPSDLPLDPALLLDRGAAKTWSAIFFYVYTGEITFAAIGSRCVVPEGAQNNCSGNDTEPPQDKELDIPASDDIIVGPCSPKSVYCLAHKIGLTKLCDVAFKTIKSQLDTTNIVQELFSPFTAEHKDIREMEHTLFQSTLKPLVDRALLSDIIGSSSSGEHPYRSAAMVLILERSIQERRERIAAIEKASQPAQPTKSSEAPRIPIQQAQPTALAPKPPQQPPSNPVSARPAPTPTKYEATPDPPTSSKLAKKVVATRKDGPPTNTTTKPPPPQDTVKLVCVGCRVGYPRSGLWSGIYCPTCPKHSDFMGCIRCGTIRNEAGKACTKCHVKFE